MRLNTTDKFIHSVIRSAGETIRKNFGVITTGTIKTSIHDIVTEADYISERVLIQAIQTKFPKHTILSEEAGLLDTQSEYTWIIDPLDGTNNFAKGIPLFGVIVALAKGDTIVQGAIYDPIHDELFYAKKGQGSTCNGRAIHVSSQTKLNEMVVAISNIPGRSDQNYFAKLRKAIALQTMYYKAYGSAAQVLSAVACGRIDSWILAGAYPWDIAAGSLLVQEAGGKITTLTNTRWQWRTNNQQVIAANPKLHKAIVQLMGKL